MVEFSDYILTPYSKTIYWNSNFRLLLDFLVIPCILSSCKVFKIGINFTYTN